MIRAAWFAIALAGCYHSDLTTCGDGTVCPHGDVCDETHGGCVAPDQLTACPASAAFATPCQAAGISGACFDNVCLPRGCGNHVVEPDLDEQCDPPGDNCSADCKSNETCGNGIVDKVKNEQCDDGNRRNHDGCDSLCRAENLRIDVNPIAPATVAPSLATFDEANHVFLHYDGSSTWGWDGTDWSLLGTHGPAGAVAMIYDTVRGHPELLVLDAAAGAYDRAYEWTPPIWTSHTLTTPPVVTGPSTLVAAYDPTANLVRAVIYNTAAVTPTDVGQTFTLDVGTKAWTAVGSASPPPLTAPTAIYDPARSVAMLVGGDGSVAEWSGTAWLAKPSSKLPQVGTTTLHDFTGVNLVYDVDRGHVVAWGGCFVDTTGVPAAYTCTSKGYQWDGTAWSLYQTPAMPGTVGGELGFDRAGHRTIFVGGVDNDPRTGFSGSMLGQLWLHDTSWNKYDTPFPAVETQGVATFAHGQGIYASRWSNTWINDGGWSHSAATGPSAVTSVAYDPIRDLVIAAHSPNLVSLATTAWQLLQTKLPVGDSSRALAFDPLGKRLVMVGFNRTWVLDSAAPDDVNTLWTQIAPAPPSAVIPADYQLAWDASCKCMVFTEQTIGVGNFTQVYELVDIGGGVLKWLPALSPGPYLATAWSARESIMFVPTQADLRIWERRGSTTERGAPSPVNFVGALYDDAKLGVVVGVGTINGFTGELVIGYHGPGGDELCDGADGDGDGLVDCADADCWWMCTPACPPGTTC